MKVSDFFFQGLNQSYQIGISQVIFKPELLESEDKFINDLFKIINQVQKENGNDVFIQLMDDELILNQEQIEIATYFVKKAFREGKNISNKKNIELMLYLCCNRQISRSIEALGLQFSKIIEGDPVLLYITSPKELNAIYEDLRAKIGFVESKFNLNDLNFAKFKKIFVYHDISLKSMQVVLKSHGFSTRLNLREKNINPQDLREFYVCLLDLLCEKMSLLSLENLRET